MILPFGLCWVVMILALGGAEADSVIVVKGRTPLFNGQNLQGFHTWLVDSKRDDPRHVFSVTNEMIRISGDGLGYLSTEHSYRDYHLQIEFKWGSTNSSWGNRLGHARDSGLFLHSRGPDGNSYDGKGAFKAAIECNIFEGATGDFLLIRGTNHDGFTIAPRLTAEIARAMDPDQWPFWKKGGTRRTLTTWGRLNWNRKDIHWQDQFGFRGRNDVEKPAGEWNRLECICNSNKITIRLNGNVVNEAVDVFPDSGPILLQCEGSEIFFRKLELQPIKQRSFRFPVIQPTP